MIWRQVCHEVQGRVIPWGELVVVVESFSCSLQRYIAHMIYMHTHLTILVLYLTLAQQNDINNTSQFTKYGKYHGMYG
jgi:hypothetical protein